MAFVYILLSTEKLINTWRWNVLRLWTNIGQKNHHNAADKTSNGELYADFGVQN